MGPQSLASSHCDVLLTLSLLVSRGSVVIKDSVLARGPFPSPYLSHNSTMCSQGCGPDPICVASVFMLWFFIVWRPLSSCGRAGVFLLPFPFLWQYPGLIFISLVCRYRTGIEVTVAE